MRTKKGKRGKERKDKKKVKNKLIFNANRIRLSLFSYRHVLLYPKSDSRGNTRRISSRCMCGAARTHTHARAFAFARRNERSRVLRRFHRASPSFPFPLPRVFVLPRLHVLVVRPPFASPREAAAALARSLSRSPSGANPACTFVCLNWVAFYARASNVNRILNYYSDCVSPSPRRYLLPVAS